jgi:hypothetical protein
MRKQLEAEIIQQRLKQEKEIEALRKQREEED